MDDSTRLLRPDWDEYFIGLVDAVATRATCDRGRSGCVIVRNNDHLAAGYVGAPPGLPHCDEIGHLFDETGKHCIRTLHAEQNAIIRAARHGVDISGTTVYCTMEPCITCAMMFISLGVVRVVAKHRYHAADVSRQMLRDAGIKLTTLSEDTLYVA